MTNRRSSLVLRVEGDSILDFLAVARSVVFWHIEGVGYCEGSGVRSVQVFPCVAESAKRCCYSSWYFCEGEEVGHGAREGGNRVAVVEWS
jgi:hypothetical protein